MVRPTFLVLEPEPDAALSTRKLVLETAKFNVVTAHSTREAAEQIAKALALFAALIVTSGVKDVESLIAQVKKAKRDFPVIFLAPNRVGARKGVDHQLSSHEPQELLDLCLKLFGDPRQLKV